MTEPALDLPVLSPLHWLYY